MSNIIELKVRDFTNTPTGRYRVEGMYSGEEFRECYLEPKYLEAVQKDTILRVNIDCMGHPSSFFNEAFGGLARKYSVTIDDIWKVIELASDEENSEEMINEVKQYATDDFTRAKILEGR